MRKLYLMLVLMFAVAIQLSAQDRTISGVITDDGGDPLPGVNVVVKGTTVGTITDIDGKYTIDVADGQNTLVFSFVGFTSQELDLGDSDTIDVTLGTDSEILDEVVVTALGFETKRGKLGTAATTVQGESLTRSGEVGLINSLAGKSAGLNVISSTGEPGAGSKIQIRGATSITGDVQPLIVIDGVPIFNDSYYGEGFGGNSAGSSGSLGSGGGVTQQSRLNDINPDDIANVEVIRGAPAAALWGSRAANGVIIITTKKGEYTGKKDVKVDVNLSAAFDQVNKEVELNEAYGQGFGSFYVQNTSLSWGDKIANRDGGADDVHDNPDDENYAGYFEAADGTRYYQLVSPVLADGEDGPIDLGGGKNDKTLYLPYEQLFKTGVTLSTNVSISSAGENGNIYFSVGRLDQDGIIKDNSTFDRTTARLNATQKMGRYLTISTNLGYTLSNSNRVQMGSNLNGLFLGGLRSAVDFNDEDYVGTYFAPDGSAFTERQRAYRNSLGNRTNSIYDNPLWMMNNILSDSQVGRFIGKLELRYEPLNWLNFTARGGLDTYTDEREDFFPVLSAGTNNGGRFTKETITRSQKNFDLIARARLDLTDDIAANLLAGFGLNDRKLDDHGSTSRSFINPESPPQLSNAAAESTSLFNYETHERTAGVYSTIGLEFFDQVFLNLSGRLDYLSTLPADDNSVFYPAADLAWNFSEALKSVDQLSSGKLRVGWGQVGRGPSPYLTNNTFYKPTAANTGYGEGWGPGVDGGAYGGANAQSTVAANATIKPEIKTEFEAGLDLGFLKDRVQLGFTYYNNITKDLIIRVDVPESSGFLAQISNAAEIENTGIELDWGLDVVRQRDLNVNVYGNFTKNSNEVTSMSGTESILLSGFAGSSSRAVLGEQLGALWGAKWDRDEDGNLVLDGNGFPTIAAEAGVIGDPNPDFKLGLGALVNYKGLSVNILFDMSRGGEIWNGTKGALTFFGRSGFTAVETTLTQEQAETLPTYVGSTVAADYPYLQNDDGSYTVRGEIKDFGGGEVFLDETWYYVGPGSGFTGPDEQFIEDASWARLRELSIGYTFRSEKLSEKTGVGDIGINFTGRNLLLWTDYTGNDPDTNLNGPGNNGIGLDYFQNPSSRTYKVSLNLSF